MVSKLETTAYPALLPLIPSFPLGDLGLETLDFLSSAVPWMPGETQGRIYLLGISVSYLASLPYFMPR